ncbi:unnamed protein product [Darwinula stevensoni]|uniref:Elongation factor 1-beta n=1 Tax=Darwinula stevensoni TaxID=69355 RepID=A0A7R9FPV3_9CRUS|nr:unnamed protein product [Darwinula stevensoni]CAG0898528.1 unnamed protein product [Darwinula stevensoni]
MPAVAVDALNKYLEDKSYIEGYVPSQADVTVFDALGGTCPQADKFPYAHRWFKHIKSYNSGEKSKFPGVKKPLDSFPGLAGSGGGSAKADQEDDDIDLFGSDDEEDAETQRIKEERLKAYADKKSKKPGVIAKSSVVLEVKPWDDETDMKELEKCVRSVQCEGLIWGASKLVPVGYGINKLQIMCVIEDEKVSVDWMQETIQEFEDFVQSVDIASFNKI